jgi:hypothetical protein
MDSSHDYSGLPNSCIPNVVPPGADPSLVDFREFYPYIPNEIKHRKRTTQAQLEILEQTFAHDKKPNGVMRANLAKQLDMTPRGVQVSLLIFTPAFIPAFLTCISLSIHRSGSRTGALAFHPFIFLDQFSSRLFFIYVGGRKKRRWPKRLLPNSSNPNCH